MAVILQEGQAVTLCIAGSFKKHLLFSLSLNNNSFQRLFMRASFGSRARMTCDSGLVDSGLGPFLHPEDSGGSQVL